MFSSFKAVKSCCSAEEFLNFFDVRWKLRDQRVKLLRFKVHLFHTIYIKLTQKDKYSYTKLQDKNNYSRCYKNVYGGKSSKGFLVFLKQRRHC